VRGAHRRMLAAVDAAGPDVLVLDATAVGMLPVTVIDQFADLERELAARDVIFWIAALPPRTLATARRTPRWDELIGDRRLYPTSLAAIRHYRDVVEASGDPRTT
ncbi:MAG TPA: hypothetical protein VFT09_00230, partial [Ilumatobacteraceae bacterium]|nr:hypothetical protein [Ilumatobacteraceae bacterium]